jgi:TonB-dependent SusC/RagA subfamily outer membrane receptor
MRIATPSLLVAVTCVLGIAGVTGCSRHDPVRGSPNPVAEEEDGSARVGEGRTLREKDLETRVQQVEEMFEGRLSGVQVIRRAGGQYSVRIRGMAGAADSEPLFVIDGVPAFAGATRALFGINPRDVASIRVLKNAAEASLYGPRGANGVILIDTKRGR